MAGGLAGSMPPTPKRDHRGQGAGSSAQPSLARQTAARAETISLQLAGALLVANAVNRRA